MVDTDLGKATILYEDPNEGTVEETVDNEHIAYFQDHWIVKTGEHEGGHDVVRRIPAQRVYFVERNVEAFEEEVGSRLSGVQSFADDIGLEVRTLRDRVESVTGDLQKELLGGAKRSDRTEGEDRAINIEIGELDEDDDSETDSDSNSEADSDSDAASDPTSDENDDR